MSNHTPQAASSAEEKQNHAWRKTEEITQMVSKEWIWNTFSLGASTVFSECECLLMLLGFMLTYCISRGCSRKKEISLNNALYFLFKTSFISELNWSLAMPPRCVCQKSTTGASWVTHQSKWGVFTGNVWLCAPEPSRVARWQHTRAGQEPQQAGPQLLVCCSRSLHCRRLFEHRGVQWFVQVFTDRL